ncbi:hypothetical protein Agub_g3112, partial [Astrephomene gubernaculifera]
MPRHRTQSQTGSSHIAQLCREGWIKLLRFCHEDCANDYWEQLAEAAERLLSCSSRVEKLSDLGSLWRSAESQLAFLGLYDRTLRALLSTDSVVSGDASDNAHRASSSRTLGDACTRVGIAMTKMLKQLFRFNCVEWRTCREVSWNGVGIMDVVASVARACIRSDMLPLLSRLVAQHWFTSVKEQLSWYEAIACLLESLLSFANRHSHDRDGGSSSTSSQGGSSGENSALIHELFQSLENSYLLEHLARGLLLHHKDATCGAASTSTNTQAPGNTSSSSPALGGAAGDALRCVLGAVEVQLLTCRKVSRDNALAAFCPLGECVQYLLVAHVAAQLHAAEAFEGAPIDDGRDLNVGGLGGGGSSSTATMYGLAADALPPILQQRCKCNRSGCKAGSDVLCTGFFHNIMLYWAAALKQDEETQQRQVIGPRAMLALSMRLAKVSLLWWQVSTGKPLKFRKDQAVSATGAAVPRAAEAGAPPPQQARRLTQKQMRKAAQQAKQVKQQNESVAAQSRAKQPQPGLLAPSSLRFRPQECPVLAMQALITAAEVMHYTAGRGRGRGRTGDRAGDGSSITAAAEVTSAGSMVGGNSADSNSTSRCNSGGAFAGSSSHTSGHSNTSGCSSSSNGGCGVVAVYPEEWWRDALASLDIVVEEPDSLEEACNVGYLFELLWLVIMHDYEGGYSHHRGLLLSSAVAANLGIAQPLGLVPCLERVLRRGLPQMPGLEVGLSQLFSSLINEEGARSLLLTVDAKQMVPFLVTTSKAVPVLVSKEVSSSDSTVDVMCSFAMYSVPKGLLDVMQLCGKVLALGATTSAQDVAAQEVPAAEVTSHGGASAPVLPGSVAIADSCRGCAAMAGHDRGANEASGDRDAGDSSDLPSISEVSTEAAERILLIGSVMAARRLPVVAATLPQVATRLLGTHTEIEEIVANMLLEWVPLLATSYLLALERHQAAAAAAWKQLLLVDMDIFSLVDVAVWATCRVAILAQGRLPIGPHNRPALPPVGPAVQAMLLAFPAEFAAAMAPRCAEMMAEPAGTGRSSSSSSGGARSKGGNGGGGGASRRGRLPVPSLVSVLRKGDHMFSEVSQRERIRRLLGDCGEEGRLSAMEEVRMGLETEHGCVAERLTPPHL